MDYLNETFLVNRAYDDLERMRSSKKKPSFPQPNIVSKDRKTFFVNFEEMCNAMNRKQEYVKSHIETETNIATSILGDNSLKFDVAVKPQQIKNLITNYIKEYIICKDCRSSITQTYREDKINYLVCDYCKSKKSFN